MIQSLRRTEDDSYSGIMTLHWNVDRPDLEEVWSRKTHPDWVDRELWGVNAAYVEQPWQRERRERREALQKIVTEEMTPDTSPLPRQAALRLNVTIPEKPLAYELPEKQLPPYPVGCGTEYPMTMHEYFWGVWQGKLYQSQVADHFGIERHYLNQIFKQWRLDVHPEEYANRIRKAPQGNPNSNKPSFTDAEVEVFQKLYMGDLSMQAAAEEVELSLYNAKQHYARWRSLYHPEDGVNTAGKKVDLKAIYSCMEKYHRGEMTLTAIRAKFSLNWADVMIYKDQWLAMHPNAGRHIKSTNMRTRYAPDEVTVRVFQQCNLGRITVKAGAEMLDELYSTFLGRYKKWRKLGCPDGIDKMFRMVEEGDLYIEDISRRHDLSPEEVRRRMDIWRKDNESLRKSST